MLVVLVVWIVSEPHLSRLFPVSKFKLREFAICVRACDDALEVDATNVKALFRYRQLVSKSGTRWHIITMTTCVDERRR